MIILFFNLNLFTFHDIKVLVFYVARKNKIQLFWIVIANLYLTEESLNKKENKFQFESIGRSLSKAFMRSFILDFNIICI